MRWRRGGWPHHALSQAGGKTSLSDARAQEEKRGAGRRVIATYSQDEYVDTSYFKDFNLTRVNLT